MKGNRAFESDFNGVADAEAEAEEAQRQAVEEAARSAGHFGAFGRGGAEAAMASEFALQDHGQWRAGGPQKKRKRPLYKTAAQVMAEVAGAAEAEATNTSETVPDPACAASSRCAPFRLLTSCMRRCDARGAPCMHHGVANGSSCRMARRTAPSATRTAR